MVSSARVAIREGGRWRRLVVAVRGGRRWRRLVVVIRCRSLWTSFVVVHRALLSVVHSCPTRVVKRFGVAGLAFGVGRGGGCWPSTIVRGRRWWCRVSWVRASGRGPWWSCVGFVGAGRHLGLLCASCVFVAVVGWLWYFVGPLLSFLDGWGRGLHVALHGVDVVAKRT